MKNLTLQFNDIKRIGHTIYNNEGLTVFICNPQTSNIEFLFLREILAIKGYEITSEKDFYWEENEDTDIEFSTNLPFEIFANL